MDKVYDSAQEAIFDIEDGATIMSGGFGLCGNPENLIRAIHEAGTEGLTIISNNCGTDEHGLGILLQTRQIDKMISSYVGENAVFEEQFLNGDLDVELTPQGTLAERIRAEGCGIPAFFTPTGYGTEVAEGKEVRWFDGDPHILEHSLSADFAFVKAQRGDTHGNLVFNKTARNFNPIMAMAADVTIAEVEELVEPGEIEPDSIHTPSVFVQRILEGEDYEKWIEQKTTRERSE
ncbi:MAG: CoA transferase subunit A [Bradymonadaceae bacterium]